LTILSLDLTSEHGSLAVRRDRQLAAEHYLHSTGGFAHLVFPAIETVLQLAGLTLQEVACFASASGPGAFTGLRVGLSAVKGLAEATGKPAVGVSNLRAMASFGNFPLRAVVLDARRGDVFTAVYDDRLQMVEDETVGKLQKWLETLTVQPDEFICPNASWLKSELAPTRFASTPTMEVPRTLAASVAECAELDMLEGRSTDPADLDANYVRRSDAELFWVDR